MNRAEWRVYNRGKQKEYRNQKRGSPPRPYTKMEEVLKANGHCPRCGMLLIAEWHIEHCADHLYTK